MHADGEIWNGVNYEHPPGVRQEVRQDVPVDRTARCSASAPTAILPADPVPGQPPLDPAGLRRLPAACRPTRQHARRPRRVPGGRPAALRRRRPRRRLAGLRPPRHGRRRGSNGTDDGDPVAAYDSPREAERPDHLQAHRRRRPRIFVGDYLGPVRTPLPSTARMVPGTYRFTVRAPGYGIVRLQKTIKGTAAQTIAFDLPAQLGLARRQGATIAAGDGLNQAQPDRRRRGHQLGPDRRGAVGRRLRGDGQAREEGHRASTSSVSALLHGANADDRQRPRRPEPLHRAPRVRDLDVQRLGRQRLLREPGRRLPRIYRARPTPSPAPRRARSLPT